MQYSGVCGVLSCLSLKAHGHAAEIEGFPYELYSVIVMAMAMMLSYSNYMCKVGCVLCHLVRV